MTQSNYSTLLSRVTGYTVITFALSFSSVSVAQNNKNQSNIYTPQNNQSNNDKGFGGFYTQLGLGYQGFSPNFSNSNYTVRGTTYGSTTQVSNAQSFIGTVTAGYDFPISSGFLLGVGAELTPVPNKSTSVGGGTVGGVNIPASNYKVNNTYNLFVSPMLPVDKSTAIYGKVGYSKANISAGPNLDSLGYSGYSVGLGYKTIVSGNFYAYVEGNYYNYGKVNDSGTAIIPGTSTSYGYSNSSTATSYNLLYGVGMRF
jgi:hypothetical protein